MTRYTIERVDHDCATGQSWDVLEGDTFGPMPHTAGPWDQIWRWRNFRPAELACEGSGRLMIYEPALDALQALRDKLGRPLVINSAYRSPSHNRAEGGSKRSRHLAAAAFDIVCHRWQQPQLIDYAKAHGFNGIGTYSTFVHVDFRARPARWKG